jgi:anaerobic selenocysteine-containing dehydrogenase
MTTKHSYCRNCLAHCGTSFTVENNRILDHQPDRENGISRGFMCIKGDMAVDLQNGVEPRLLSCLKRTPAGGFEPVAAPTLMDEVAARLGAIMSEHGPRAVALFYGTSAYAKSYSVPIAKAFLHELGTPNLFSTMTIDQSARWVTDGRMGTFATGRPHVDDVHTLLISGSNPIVSHACGSFAMTNNQQAAFLKRLKDRGGKLIVVDPRATETARRADIHLHPLPGHDAAIFAALIRIVLANDWQNAAFCNQYVGNLDALRRAVEPFLPERVAERADVPVSALFEIAETFACSPKPSAGFGTGTSMSPDGITAAHMIEALNAICAGFTRAGDTLHNPGIFVKRATTELVIPPSRSWERGPKLRSGHGQLYGEFPSSRLADEILEPGEGQIRALIVLGANPRMAFGDPDRFTLALKRLDLLVVLDPRMTETAELAHYIVAPPVQYEVADASLYSDVMFPTPFAQVTAPVVNPPEGCLAEWKFFNGIANRLGRVLTVKPFRFGVDLMSMEGGLVLTMDRDWTTEDIVRFYVDGTGIPFDVLSRHPHGMTPELGHPIVQPGISDGPRLDVCPPDVAGELAALNANVEDECTSGYLLVNRRIVETFNSAFRLSPITQRRLGVNRLFMNPDDMLADGIIEGAAVKISGAHGHITAYVAAERGLRRRVVSMTHCWGNIDQEADPLGLHGAHTARLVSMDLPNVGPIDAMPQQSAIPVTVLPVQGGEIEEKRIGN